MSRSSVRHTNAGIETLSDDVGQSIVEGQVQRNFGNCARNRGIAEPRKKSAAGGGAVRRNRPAGRLRNSFADPARLVLVKYRAKRSRRRSPAAVGATDRVVSAQPPHAEAFLEVGTISLTRGGDKASCLARLGEAFQLNEATKGGSFRQDSVRASACPLFGKPE